MSQGANEPSRASYQASSFCPSLRLGEGGQVRCGELGGASLGDMEGVSIGARCEDMTVELRDGFRLSATVTPKISPYITFPPYVSPYFFIFRSGSP
jgi:hypothetical protein